MIDSMIVRTPACRCRTHRQRRTDTQGLGRSRGELSSKIHLAADAWGNLVRMTFTGRQRNDITKAHDLIEGFDPDAVIADNGYDADHLRDAVEDAGGEPVIPPKSNRKTPKNYDRALYKDAISSSVSSSSSSISGMSQPDMTNFSPITGASSSSLQ